MAHPTKLASVPLGVTVLTGEEPAPSGRRRLLRGPHHGILSSAACAASRSAQSAECAERRMAVTTLRRDGIDPLRRKRACVISITD